MTQEVPAPAAGVLAEIVLDTDAEAVPGALLGRIDARKLPPGAGRSPAKRDACKAGTKRSLDWAPACAEAR